MYSPRGVFISEANGRVVRIVNVTSGIIRRYAGTGFSGYDGDGSDATSANLNFPLQLAAGDSNDNLFIADANNNVVRRVKYSSSQKNNIL